MTFKYFCYAFLDGLYDPLFTEDKQCTGYHQLKKMVKEGIAPASHEEVQHWRETPTLVEVFKSPDIKYLNFLHPLVRPVVINNWPAIKALDVSENDNCEIQKLFIELKKLSSEKKSWEVQVNNLRIEYERAHKEKNELQTKYDSLKKQFDLNAFYEQNI
jgi:hypothetical protein